jgi:hypothetical protein
MKPILTYNVKVFRNFFCISFINTESQKQSEYYSFNDKKLNANTIIQIVNNCFLVGYENSSFDDIILNYICYQKSTDVHEVYELSKAIAKQKNSERELWHDSDIEFYMFKDVKSFDISETSSIDGIVKDSDLSLKEEDIDIILLNNMQDAQQINMALNALKIRFKYGFRSLSKVRVTKESIRENYIMKLLNI